MSNKSQKLLSKHVLITGASSGLGEQIAYEAAEKGASVILTAKRIDRFKEVEMRCREISGVNAYSYQMDLSNPDHVTVVVDSIIQEFDSIDVLVNNAGFGLFAEALNAPKDVTKEMFQVNVLSLIEITRRIASKMKTTGFGHVINIASQASKIVTIKSASLCFYKVCCTRHLGPFWAVLCKPPLPPPLPYRTNVRQWGRGGEEVKCAHFSRRRRTLPGFFCAFSARPAFGNRIYDPLVFVRFEFDPLTLFWLTLTWLTLVGLTLTR